MICTNGADRGRLVRSNRYTSLFTEYAGVGVSPLLAVCHEAALAPEEGGVPACGEDRRVASGTEGSPTWRMKRRSYVVHECVHGLRGRACRCADSATDAQNSETDAQNSETDAQNSEADAKNSKTNVCNGATDARNDMPMREKAIPVPSGSICELANAAQMRLIASRTAGPSAKRMGAWC